MVAGVAFHSNKNSGLNFRKFPVWNGTTFSEISEKVQPRGGWPNFSKISIPLSPFPRISVQWFTFRKFNNFRSFRKLSQKCLRFPRIKSSGIFAPLESALHSKNYPALNNRWFLKSNNVFFLLSKPYQVGVPPPTRCRKTQLSWSVHLGRLCQQLFWSKPLPHCSSDACSLHRNPRHLEPAESPGHQRRKKDKCTLS